jgi:hypothetical protein
MHEPVRIRWRRLDTPGVDDATLAADGDGWSLSGLATVSDSGRACRLEYDVQCDASWHSRRCTVRGTLGTEQVALLIARGEAGRWTVDGQALAAIDGCEDVDLAFTPATNLLPIRRLQLAIGHRAQVRAAWVRFPRFDVEVLEQHYTRLADDRYLYESAGGAFRRELRVDEHGLVLEYPGLWVAERAD